MRRGNRNFRIRGRNMQSNRQRINQTNRRINNQNRQINNLQRKVKNINIQRNNNNNNIAKMRNELMGRVRYNVNAYPIQSSNYKMGGLVRSISDGHKEAVLNYIADVLEPELSVTRNHQVKMPNLFPIPSAAIGFRDHYNIRTNSSGDFFLAWNPNYLVNKQYLDSIVLYGSNNQEYSPNAYARLVVKDLGKEALQYMPSYVPDVAFTKYRLVSAKIKVTYVGSNLNKSGMLYACATYDQTPVAIGRLNNNQTTFIARDPTNESAIEFTDINGTKNNQYDILNVTSPAFQTVKNMNEQTIANGIWNKSVNIVQSNQGISCTHIPSDPTNEIFYPTGEYFGYDYKDPSNYTVAAYTNTLALSNASNSFSLPFTQVISDQGSQLCYLIMGHGLPVDNECINIQCFYNFEIIPTLSSAPFMRSSSLSAEFNNRELKLMSTVVKNNAEKMAIRTGNKTANISEPFITKLARWGGYAASVAKIVALLASAV